MSVADSGTGAVGTYTYGDFTLTTEDGLVVQEDNIFTLTAAGTYTASGTLEGQIIVNAGDEDDVVLELTGADITYGENSPIYCVNASDFDISAKKGTSNSVTDTRDNVVEDITYFFTDTQGWGSTIYAYLWNSSTSAYNKAWPGDTCTYVGVDSDNQPIYSYTFSEEDEYDYIIFDDGSNQTCDIPISTYDSGTGFVYGSSSTYSTYEYYGDVEEETSAAGKGAIYAKCDLKLKGTGELTVSGNYKNGIHSSDDLKIQKLTLDVESYKHALKGSDSITVASGTINAVANKGDAFHTSNSHLGSSSGEQKGSITIEDGTITTYSYGDAFDAAYDVVVSGGTIESYTNTYASSEISSLAETSSTNALTTKAGPGGQGGQGGQGGPGGTPGSQTTTDGNSNKADNSAKGLKAHNAVSVSGGTITLKTYDDGIHATYGDTLESGAIGAGDVAISGGSLSIYASDDGVHADMELDITGGSVDVTYSYEGLEAETLNIAGGESYVCATDDGLNASAYASATPSINISDGLVDVTVASGDVDGIDSNGNYTQTGGVVITRGAPNSNNSMASSMDVDGTCKVTGGTFISVGAPETSPSKGSGVYGCTFASSSTSLSSGTAALSALDVSFSLTSTYYGPIYVYSSSFTKGTSYTLTLGSKSYSATAA